MIAVLRWIPQSAWWLGIAIWPPLIWWERHIHSRRVRRKVIGDYGRDVDVDAVGYMRRDGAVVDETGQATYIGDRVDHDDWVEGSEPTE